MGLSEEGTQSPAVQEIAALTVSPMPAAQAEHLVQRLAGIKTSAVTLGRAARQQGERALEKRDRLNEPMSTPEGRTQQDQTFNSNWPLDPFTLIIELDAWNIRERDDWGLSRETRAAGKNLPAGTGFMAAPAFA